ncbi:MAG: M20/M25/M40 family metallo-hydrolase [Gemmatimonadota bacterium]|jgi:hypothetical protein
MPPRIALSALALVLLGAGCDAGGAPVNEYGNPDKLAPRPTESAITEADLKTRLYIFSDDSMMGRQFGREGNMKGTAYIARELERLGVEPAGDNGTYFQNLPAVVRKYTDASTMSVDGQALTWLTDFVATPGNAPPLPLEGVQVVYGGMMGDTVNPITAEQANGRLVVLSLNPEGGRRGFFAFGGRGGRGRGNAQPNPLAGAAAIATINLDDMSMEQRAFVNNPPGRMPRSTDTSAPEPVPANLRLTSAAAERLLGGPVADMQPGTLGGTVTAHLDYVEQPVPDYARNVVGIVRGSDPELAGEYVAVGAHNDHNGFRVPPVDHDSLKAFNQAALDLQMASGDLTRLTQEQRASIHVNVDSLRALRPERLDSIQNGADDDGSGSMAVLEIAEAFATAPEKPRRSILFVFHTGEEAGLLGSRWFTDHPTVPRDSIVTQINIDMIGRGRAEDIIGGGPTYLGVVGSKRLSTELGQLVQEVNNKEAQPLDLDYRFDEETTWPGYNNIYGRSDHANYARYGIPIAFFFTGLHADYHQNTDEAQYIDYPHYTRITQYIDDLVTAIANRDHRPIVDQIVQENR